MIKKAFLENLETRGNDTMYRTQFAKAEALAALAWMYPFQIAEIRASLTHLRNSSRTARARSILAKKHPEEFKRIYRGARELYAPYKLGTAEEYSETWEKAKALLVRGKTPYAVAKELGVNRAWVSQKYKKELSKRGGNG